MKKRVTIYEIPCKAKIKNKSIHQVMLFIFCGCIKLRLRHKRVTYCDGVVELATYTVRKGVSGREPLVWELNFLQTRESARTPQQLTGSRSSCRFRKILLAP